MSFRNLLAGIGVTASLLIGSAAVATAQIPPSISWRYNFVKLDYPNAPVSFPLGINSKRQIVGVRIDSKGVDHGYLYQDGKFTDIDYPGASQIFQGGTFTGGINDRGDVAGFFTDSKGFQHGFLRTMPDDCDDDSKDSKCKPVYRQIDVPGAAQTKGIDFETGPGLGTAAIGVNNHQDVVGLYASPQLYSLGFELTHGKFITINDPAAGHTPGTGSRLFGLNDNGVVVGAYANQLSPTAFPISGGFLFTGKEYLPVYVPGSEKGGFGTQANGINNREEVVGVYTDPQGVFHGLFWAGRQPFTLDFPNTPYSECHSINSRGDITGAYIIDPSGANYRGFVAFLKDDKDDDR